MFFLVQVNFNLNKKNYFLVGFKRNINLIKKGLAFYAYFQKEEINSMHRKERVLYQSVLEKLKIRT